MDRYSGTVRINYIGIMYMLGLGGCIRERRYFCTCVIAYYALHSVALDSGFSWNGPHKVCGRSRIHNMCCFQHANKVS